MSDKKHPEDFDPFPFFVLEGNKVDEASYQEQYGPPYGPCGQSCNCDSCQGYRKQLRKEGPKVPYRAPKEEDPFEKAIKKVLANEPREEYREAISETACFARMWKLHPGSEEHCEMAVECELSNHCEQTYNTVIHLIQEKEANKKAIKKPSKKVAQKHELERSGRKNKYINRKLWQGKYSRIPYVYQGRPIDNIAKALFEFLGEPPHLPLDWKYGPSVTQSQHNDSIDDFILRYGDGLFVVKRHSYHMYMFQGRHLFRLWVAQRYGGNCDLCEELVNIVLRLNKLPVEKTPRGESKASRVKYRFFRQRTYLSHVNSVRNFRLALAQCKGLEYLQEKAEKLYKSDSQDNYDTLYPAEYDEHGL